MQLLVGLLLALILLLGLVDSSNLNLKSTLEKCPSMFGASFTSSQKEKLCKEAVHHPSTAACSLEAKAKLGSAIKIEEISALCSGATENPDAPISCFKMVLGTGDKSNRQLALDVCGNVTSYATAECWSFLRSRIKEASSKNFLSTQSKLIGYCRNSANIDSMTCLEGVAKHTALNNALSLLDLSASCASYIAENNYKLSAASFDYCLSNMQDYLGIKGKISKAFLNAQERTTVTNIVIARA